MGSRLPRASVFVPVKLGYSLQVLLFSLSCHSQKYKVCLILRSKQDSADGWKCLGPETSLLSENMFFISYVQGKCKLVDFFKGNLFLITKTFRLIRMYIQLICFYCHC